MYFYVDIEKSLILLEIHILLSTFYANYSLMYEE